VPQPIGVLVDKNTLAKSMRGRSTTERIGLYRSVARELGIDIIVFSIENVSTSQNRLTGYVPTPSGWKRAYAAIPTVIHKRVLYRSNAPLQKLKRLHRRGTIFINPPLMQNKAKMSRTLANDLAVRPHLPQTFPYRWDLLAALLDRGVGIVLKPRVGSVGQGIMRLIPRDGERVELTKSSTRLLSRAALRRRIRASIGSRRYLMQQYVNLARYHGRPFDLRVPVQRDESGRWRLSGMVAKVANKHAFLTNAGQGGLLLPGETALRHAFPTSTPDIVQRVGEVAVNVAKAVAREHPYAADLGLDMGVDVDGKPWLIEVNSRDQRYTFHEAGMEDAFRSLYRNPLAFCAHLMQLVESGKSWSPQDNP